MTDRACRPAPPVPILRGFIGGMTKKLLFRIYYELVKLNITHLLMKTERSHEYINEFMYFVLRPDESRGRNALLYCSGVDLSRLLPITKGRHRASANPAMRGLQLVNLGVRSLALSCGATPRAIRGDDCAGIVPPKNGWYKDLLLIENAPESLPEDIINYCVINLLRKIFNGCLLLDEKLPDTLLKPDELQLFIEKMCIKYGSD